MCCYVLLFPVVRGHGRCWRSSAPFCCWDFCCWSHRWSTVPGAWTLTQCLRSWIPWSKMLPGARSLEWLGMPGCWSTIAVSTKEDGADRSNHEKRLKKGYQGAKWLEDARSSSSERSHSLRWLELVTSFEDKRIQKERPTCPTTIVHAQSEDYASGMAPTCAHRDSPRSSSIHVILVHSVYHESHL